MLLRHSTFEAPLPALVWLAIWLDLLPLSTNELLTSDTASKQNEFLGKIAQRGTKSRTETAELCRQKSFPKSSTALTTNTRKILKLLRHGWPPEPSNAGINWKSLAKKSTNLRRVQKGGGRLVTTNSFIMRPAAQLQRSTPFRLDYSVRWRTILSVMITHR